MDRRKVKRLMLVVVIALVVVGAVIGLMGTEPLPAWLMDWPAAVRMLAMAVVVPGAVLIQCALLAGTLWVTWQLLRLYFLPSIIAHRRGHPQKTPILIVNALLTPIFGIGWVVALAWANSALPVAPAPAAATAAGFCPHCGAARGAGAFCPGCGAKLG